MEPVDFRVRVKPEAYTDLNDTKNIASQSASLVTSYSPEEPLDLRVRVNQPNIKVEIGEEPVSQPQRMNGSADVDIPKTSLLKALLNLNNRDDEECNELVIDCGVNQESQQKKTKRDRTSAFRTRSVKPWKCRLCSKRFSYNSNLEKHMLIHELTKKYVCTKCGMKFLKMCSLQKHNWKVCNNMEEKGVTHSCSQCDMVFEDGPSLKNHMRYHKWERHANCTKCRDLKNPTATAENGESATVPLVYKCDECGKKIRNEKTGRMSGRPSREDLLASQHSCDTCGKRFLRLANLTKHQAKKHHGSFKKLSVESST